MLLYREPLKSLDTYCFCRCFVITILPGFVLLSGTSGLLYSILHVELFVRTYLEENNIQVIVCTLINLDTSEKIRALRGKYYPILAMPSLPSHSGYFTSGNRVLMLPFQIGEKGQGGAPEPAFGCTCNFSIGIKGWAALRGGLRNSLRWNTDKLFSKVWPDQWKHFWCW